MGEVIAVDFRSRRPAPPPDLAVDFVVCGLLASAAACYLMAAWLGGTTRQ